MLARERDTEILFRIETGKHRRGKEGGAREREKQKTPVVCVALVYDAPAYHIYEPPF